MADLGAETVNPPPPKKKEFVDDNVTFGQIAYTLMVTWPLLCL